MNIEKYDKVENEDGSILLTPKEVDKDWFPNGGDFHQVTAHGKVSHVNGRNTITAGCALGHHNIFELEAVAEKAAKLQRVSNAIIRACLLVDPDYTPYFEDDDTKHTVYYCRQWNTTTSQGFCSIHAAAHVSTAEKAKEVAGLLTKWGVKP